MSHSIWIYMYWGLTDLVHGFCSVEVNWCLLSRVSFLRDRNGQENQCRTVLTNSSEISVAFNKLLFFTHTRYLLAHQLQLCSTSFWHRSGLMKQPVYSCEKITLTKFMPGWKHVASTSFFHWRKQVRRLGLTSVAGGSLFFPSERERVFSVS